MYFIPKKSKKIEKGEFEQLYISLTRKHFKNDHIEIIDNAFSLILGRFSSQVQARLFDEVDAYGTFDIQCGYTIIDWKIKKRI
ncbi:MAG: hypothetical protein ACFFG0_36625 [Candidatus Thorarchaeota archaeon]